MRLRVFDLKVSNFVFRFYLMIAIVALCVFLNQIVLASILGFTIAITTVLGVSFTWTKTDTIDKTERKIIPLEKGRPMKHAG